MRAIEVIDLSDFDEDFEAASGNPFHSNIPDGTYHAHIEKVELTTVMVMPKPRSTLLMPISKLAQPTESGDKPKPKRRKPIKQQMIKWQFKIIGPGSDYIGRMLFKNSVITGETVQQIRRELVLIRARVDRFQDLGKRLEGLADEFAAMGDVIKVRKKARNVYIDGLAV